MGKKKNRFLGFLCFAAVLIPLFSLNVFAAGEDIFTLGDRIIRDGAGGAYVGNCCNNGKARRDSTKV